MTDKTSIFKPVRTDLKESLSLSHATYDEYIDVFDTYAEAERFYLANLEEKVVEIYAIEVTIKQEMTVRATDELITGEYKICWKEITSKRFDTSAFRKTYSNLYEQFIKTATTRRFIIA